MILIIITKYLLIYELEENRNLMINTLSGAVDVVDNITKKYIENNEIPEDKQIVEKLIKRKYILKNEEEEKKLFNSFRKHLDYITYGADTKRRIVFVLCPTYNCNLRCTYCFQSHSMHKLEQVMSKEQVDEAFDMMQNKILPFMDAGGYVIQLFGGEPLQIMTKDVVKYIFDKSKHDNTQISITTNGMNIECFMDIFNENKDRLLFQVTLDGIKEIHDKRRIQANGRGSFDIILKNINLLLENGFNVNVRVNTSVDTVKNIPKLIEVFKENNWCNNKKFRGILAPVTEHNSMPSCTSIGEFEIFEEIYKLYPDIESLRRKYSVELGADMYRVVGHLNRIIKPNIVPRHALPSLAFCEAALLTMFYYGPDGFIYACGESLGEKDFSIASYYPKKEIFYEKIEQWKDRTILNMKECSECNIATLCGGGCPFAALKFNGNARTGFCGNTRNTIDNYMNNNLVLK